MCLATFLKNLNRLILKNNVCVRNMVSFWGKKKTTVETATMLKEAVKDKSVSKLMFVPTDEAGFEMKAFG